MSINTEVQETIISPWLLDVFDSHDQPIFICSEFKEIKMGNRKFKELFDIDQIPLEIEISQYPSFLAFSQWLNNISFQNAEDNVHHFAFLSSQQQAFYLHKNKYPLPNNELGYCLRIQWLNLGDANGFDFIDPVSAKNLFLHEPECVKIVSYDGKLLDMNPAGLAIIECHDKNMVLGHQVINLIHPEDRKKFIALHNKASKGKQGSDSFRIITLDKNVKWMESHSVPIPSDNPKLFNVLSVTRDITEKKNRDSKVKLEEKIIALKNEFFSLILSEEDTKRSLQKALAFINKQFQCALSEIWFPESDQKHMRLYTYACDDDLIIQQFVQPSLHLNLPITFGSHFQALKQNRPIWMDLNNAELSPYRRDAYLQSDFKGGLSFSLKFHHSSTAFLVLFWNQEAIPKTLVFEFLNAISEQFGLELARRRTNDELQQYFSIIPELLCVIDFEGKFVKTNPAFYHMLGYPQDPLVGEPIWDIIHPQDRKKTFHEFVRIKNGGGTSSDFQIRCLCANGGFKWVSWTATISLDQKSIYASGRDISHEILQLEQLKQSNERFSIVLNTTQDAIWEWDLYTNEIYWGDGLKNQYGWDFAPEESTPETWNKMVHPSDYERIAASMANLFNPQSEQQHWEEEFRFLKQNGEYAFVLNRAQLLKNSEGTPLKVVGAMMDITERKIYEFHLKQLNEKLTQRAEELTAINHDLERFAYVASHDLQEPLRMISSFLQLLQKKYRTALDETANQYIKFAVNGADRLKQLINDLLEYSKLGTNNLEWKTIQPESVIQYLTGIFSQEIEQLKGSLTFHHFPVVAGRENQFIQLLQNLISNALKYRKKDSPPEIKIHVLDKSTHWEFCVSDNGIGIDPQYFKKIFVIFQRLHNHEQYEGTGIGLGMCKKIVESHKGEIWVESAPNMGSKFYFTWPK